MSQNQNPRDQELPPRRMTAARGSSSSAFAIGGSSSALAFAIGGSSSALAFDTAVVASSGSSSSSAVSTREAPPSSSSTPVTRPRSPPGFSKPRHRAILNTGSAPSDRTMPLPRPVLDLDSTQTPLRRGIIHTGSGSGSAPSDRTMQPPYVHSWPLFSAPRPGAIARGSSSSAFATAGSSSALAFAIGGSSSALAFDTAVVASSGTASTLAVDSGGSLAIDTAVVASSGTASALAVDSELSYYDASSPSHVFASLYYSYGAPSSQHSFLTYGAPSSQHGFTTYGAQSSQYSFPVVSSSDGAPSSQYGLPTYGAPSSSDGAPSSQYGFAPLSSGTVSTPVEPAHGAYGPAAMSGGGRMAAAEITLAPDPEDDFLARSARLYSTPRPTLSVPPPSPAVPPPPPIPAKQGDPKTEICYHWANGSRCPWGRECSFAHGEWERVEIDRSVYYRTIPCRNARPCPYGHRCKFKHEDGKY